MLHIAFAIITLIVLLIAIASAYIGTRRASEEMVPKPVSYPVLNMQQDIIESRFFSAAT